MALTIDNLEIQISSNATKANKGIDALATSLENLKSAVGGAKGVASQLSTLTLAFKSLGSVSKIGLSSNVNALKKLETLNLSGVSQQLKDLSVGFSHLNTIQKGNLGSVLSQLKKIPEITKSLDNATIESFTVAIRKLSEALAPLATQMDAVARGFSSLPSHMQRAIKASHNVANVNNKTTKSYNSLFTSVSRGAARFWTLYYTFRRVAGVIADCYNESNEYIESLNLFTVSLGDAAEGAREYAESLGKIMGIDPADWMQNQGVFMRMATGFGVSAENAEIMSQNLTQLGYDMASFFNADVETAMQKIQSGMSGQIKGLKAWGYNLSVAALQETALSLGIEQSVRSMSEAQKAQLRYITLMQKSQGVMNDMARTINTPANSLRILSAQLTQMKRAFGNLVSVIATKVIPYVQAFVELMTEAAQSLADAWGFELTEIDYSSLDLAADTVDGVGDSAEDAENEVAKLKKQLMGFDELNILKSGDDDKGADGLASNDLGIELPEYDFLEGFSSQYREKIDEIKEKFRELGETASLVGQIIAGIFVFAGIKGAVSAVTGLFNAFKKGYTILGKLSPAMKSVASAIAVYAEFAVVKKSLKEFIKGNKDLGDALMEIIPITALVGTAMYAMMGPLGLVITAVAALAGAYGAAYEAQFEMHYELAKTHYYENNGIAIDKLRDSLKNYFDAMDFDKQAEWLEKIENSQKAYEDARDEYDLMWQTIASKPVFDASDIEGLTRAFNDLATAAKNVNDVKIGSVMESIKLAIELNITPELEGRLEGLKEELIGINVALGNEMNTAVKEYGDLMNEVANNGGVMTDEQKAEAERLRKEIENLTIGGDKNAVEWERALEEALEGPIYAGADDQEVLKNVEDLMGDRDSYIEIIKNKRDADIATLQDLVNKGYLDASYLDDYERAYEAQLSEVYKKYDETLQKIISTYESTAFDPADYDRGWWYETVEAKLFGHQKNDKGETGAEYFANKALMQEQQKLLEELRKKLWGGSFNMPGYASGGFPSMGEMFIARESGPELVGRIGNKNAVANNDQITAGIASAVYSAMMAAHEDNDGNGSSGRIIVQIGEETVGEAAVRFINGRIVQTGESPIYA